MRTYTPSYAGKDDAARREFQALVEAARRPDPYAHYEYLTVEPQRPQAGMEVLADGVNWNPGSGEGKYRRNAANNAWVFLG